VAMDEHGRLWIIDSFSDSLCPPDDAGAGIGWVEEFRGRLVRLWSGPMLVAPLAC